MATYNIVVRVDPSQAARGARQVESSLNRISASADRVRRLIGTAFTFSAIAIGVRQIQQLSDAYTGMQNRLRVVTDGQAQLAVVTQELFDISNRTRSSFEGTAELYSRVALASRELGVSQKQLLEFTESVNKAILLSGASTREANAGLIQLSQGIASGTLRGDELRSVLEQLPVVADVIAKSLGVTRGELRQLGFEGKITAQVVLDAFKKARQELEDRFASALPTIGQSLEVVRNRFIELIGNFEKSTGVLQNLARGILFIADNLELLVRIATAAGVALAINFARIGINAAIAGIARLTVALTVNPFTAFITILTGAIALLVAFGDQIKLTEGSTATTLDFLVEVFGRFASGVQTAIGFVLRLFGVFQGSLDGFDFLDFVRAGAKALDTLVAVVFGAQKAIEASLKALPETIGFFVVEALNGLIVLVTDFTNDFISILNKLPGADFALIDAPKLENPFRQAGADLGNAFVRGYGDALKVGLAQDFVNDAASDAESKAVERARKQAELQRQLDEARGQLGVAGINQTANRPDAKFQEVLNRIRDEGNLLRLTNQEREIQEGLLKAEYKLKRDLTPVEKSLVEEQLRHNQVLRDQRQILDDLNGPTEDLLRRRTALVQLFDDGAISARQFNEEMRRLTTELTALDNTVQGGILNGFARVAEEANNLGKNISDFVVGAFQQAGDAIDEFVRTGKFSLRSFFADLFAQLGRLALNQVFAQLAGGFGGGGGGFFGKLLGGFLGAPGFANGGAFTVGQNTSMANLPGRDNRLVAFRARDGERVSVSTPGKSDGSGSTRVVNVSNVYNIQTPDAESFRRSQGQILAKSSAALERAARRDR